MPAADWRKERTMNATRTGRVNRRLGGRLRHLRRARGFTTTTLGKAVGLSQAQISRVETGAQGIRAPVLMRLARVLRVSPEVFFMDTATARKILKAVPRIGIKGLGLIADE